MLGGNCYCTIHMQIQHDTHNPYQPVPRPRLYLLLISYEHFASAIVRNVIFLTQCWMSHRRDSCNVTEDQVFNFACTDADDLLPENGSFQNWSIKISRISYIILLNYNSISILYLSYFKNIPFKRGFLYDFEFFN